MCGGRPCRAGRTVNPDPFSFPDAQNIMPLSAAMFLSERKNPAPQCPPRLEVQMLMPVSWSRMPNHFLHVDTRRAGERLGWAVQCQEPLMMMALHIPEENRSGPCCARCPPQLQPQDYTRSQEAPGLNQRTLAQHQPPQIAHQGALDPSQ